MHAVVCVCGHAHHGMYMEVRPALGVGPHLPQVEARSVFTAWASWLRVSGRSPVCPHFHRVQDCRHKRTVSGFHVGPRDPHSGCQAFAAGAFPDAPSLPP